jgi:hypothetical protein
MLAVCRIAGAMMTVRVRGMLGRLAPTRQLWMLRISGLGRRGRVAGVLLEAFPARMVVCDGMMGVIRHRGPMVVVVSGGVSALVLSGRLTMPVMTAVSIVHSHLR